MTHRPHPDLLKSPGFRAGLRQLAKRGLSFNATVFHHQLAELGDIAAENPGLTIVLSHMGLAMAMGMDAQGRAEIFQLWRKALREVAKNPNIVCKIADWVRHTGSPGSTGALIQQAISSWPPRGSLTSKQRLKHLELTAA